ncbi:hypothetical protein WDU94_004205, partial [Cyamophila willieti]
SSLFAGLPIAKSDYILPANSCKHFFSTIKCTGLNKSYSLPSPSSSQLKAILDQPNFNHHVKIDIPVQPFVIEKIDKFDNKINANIEDPVLPGQVPEKHAIVMIIKRKKKMKKHKLKKLRIRMKFEWAKTRQRREIKKEKAFQLEMSTKVKEGDRFNAEQYVENKLNLLHVEQLPEKWNGVPEWFVKEWTDRKKQVKSEKQAKRERRKALPSLLVKDWGVNSPSN